MRRLFPLVVCVIALPALASPPGLGAKPQRLVVGNPNLRQKFYDSLVNLHYGVQLGLERFSEATLFGIEGLRPKDVFQGNLGDCHLLGPLAAIAHAAPGFLERLFERGPDGELAVREVDGKDVIHVRMHVQTGARSDLDNAGEVLPQLVGVTPEVALAAGRPAFARTIPARGPYKLPKLGIAMLEKAYWAWKQTWDPTRDMTSDATDGYGDLVLAEITGLPAQLRRINTVSAEEVRAVGEDLRAAQRESRAVVAWANRGWLSGRLATAAAQGLIPADWHAPSFEPALYVNHNYAFTGIFEHNGQTMVSLYDPNGHVRVVSLTHFAIFFNGLGISSPLRNAL